MQKVLFVSHCLLNTASKVVMYNEKDIADEEELRRRFVKAALDKGVQLVQLPCPEFTLYGSRRWGHTSDQFDNVFFRAHCKKLLEPVIEQYEEYLSNPDRFEVLGFAGIDGSPSCGVKYTCFGKWGGNLGDRDDLPETVSGASLGEGNGVMFSVLREMLAERGIEAKFTGLFAAEPERIMELAK